MCSSPGRPFLHAVFMVFFSCWNCNKRPCITLHNCITMHGTKNIKNTWWIKTVRYRHLCHSSSSLIKGKCWVCVFQASLCAECWDLCWHLTKWKCVDFRMVSRSVTTRHNVVFVLQSLCLSTPDSPEVVDSCHTIVNSPRTVSVAESPGTENHFSLPIHSPELLFIYPFRSGVWMTKLKNTQCVEVLTLHKVDLNCFVMMRAGLVIHG
jgi:hypothetical protein